jgi:hypothetical protein
MSFATHPAGLLAERFGLSSIEVRATMLSRQHSPREGFMANKSQGTWYVSFELPRRKRPNRAHARATETFPNELEAKKLRSLPWEHERLYVVPTRGIKKPRTMPGPHPGRGRGDRLSWKVLQPALKVLAQYQVFCAVLTHG